MVSRKILTAESKATARRLLVEMLGCLIATVFDTVVKNGKKAAFGAVFVCQKLCHNQSINNRGCFTGFDT